MVHSLVVSVADYDLDARRLSYVPMPDIMLLAPEAPQRSASFKHRRTGEDHQGANRRRSTPNEKTAVIRTKSATDRRTPDRWPAAPKQQPFLTLPDSEEYLRLRQFEIDRKGAVINRGDSFRRRAGSSSTGQLSESRSGSIGSESSLTEQNAVASYDVYVLGETTTGKSAVIRQLMTSEHANPFTDEPETSQENTVSISIDGEITEFIFFEGGNDEDQLSMTRLASAYIILYSIDSRSSFRHATQLIDNLRKSAHTANRAIILAGNKCDLARKRQVSTHEATALARECECVAYEISVALNLGIDELLVALLTEIKQMRLRRQLKAQRSPHHRIEQSDAGNQHQRLNISSSLRRFSMRRKKQGHRPDDIQITGNGLVVSRNSHELRASCGNIFGKLSSYFRNNDMPSHVLTRDLSAL